MEIKYNKTASIDVDAQKGFTLICPNELPVPHGDEIVEALNEQAKFARIRIGTKDAHPPGATWETDEDHPIFSAVGTKNVDIRWPAHCIVGTKGFELLDGLPGVDEYDFFVFKGVEKDMHPYGNCYHDLKEKISTGLIEFLKQNYIETVIVGGLATEYCVKTTAMQLSKIPGLRVIVNMDACRGLNDGDIVKAIVDMEDVGISVFSGPDALTYLNIL